MASVKIDPEGGYPNYSGEGATGNNTKQANEEPQQIPVEGSSADTTGAIPPYKESGK